MDLSELLFATTNEGKLHEASAVGAARGVVFFGLDRVSSELGEPPPCIAEGEPTYEANAVRKAQGYAQWSGRLTVADDTGLEVDCSGGLPGVFTARFGLARFKDLLGSLRSCDAAFVCCVAYAEPSGRTVSVMTRVPGVVTVEPNLCSLNGSLPYSSLFIPSGQSRPLAELVASGEYLSHRGMALRKLFTALGM